MADEMIRLVGGDALSDEERLLVEKLALRYSEKIERALGHKAEIAVHIKTHKKAQEEPTKKFSVHVHVTSPSSVIKSSQAMNWELAASVHEAFDEIERQIQHSNKKNY